MDNTDIPSITSQLRSIVILGKSEMYYGDYAAASLDLLTLSSDLRKIAYSQKPEVTSTEGLSFDDKLDVFDAIGQIAAKLATPEKANLVALSDTLLVLSRSLAEAEIAHEEENLHAGRERYSLELDSKLMIEEAEYKAEQDASHERTVKTGSEEIRRISPDELPGARRKLPDRKCYPPVDAERFYHKQRKSGALLERPPSQACRVLRNLISAGFGEQHVRRHVKQVAYKGLLRKGELRFLLSEIDRTFNARKDATTSESVDVFVEDLRGRRSPAKQQLIRSPRLNQPKEVKTTNCSNREGYSAFSDARLKGSVDVQAVSAVPSASLIFGVAGFSFKMRETRVRMRRC